MVYGLPLSKRYTMVSYTNLANCIMKDRFTPVLATWDIRSLKPKMHVKKFEGAAIGYGG